MKKNRPRRRRIWRLVILAPLVILVSLALWGVMDAREGASARTVWNYTWPGPAGGERGGYLVTPEAAVRLVPLSDRNVDDRIRTPRSGDGRYPAVILIHEWWGLNLDTAHMAERLALDGYIVLAPDLLRGDLSVSVPGALVQMITHRKSDIAADLDLAYSQLQGVPQVDPQRVAVVGFCFGGTQAMLMGARRDDLAAVGIFYGGGPITTPEELGFLGQRAAVYGAYGRDDRTIAAEDVAAFAALLRSRPAPSEITLYDGVGHAFVNPQSLRSDATARAAWDGLRRFLSEEL